MLEWLRRLIRAPAPSGPEEEIGRIPPGTAPISSDGATQDGEGWRVTFDGEAPVPLFDLPLPEIYGCLLTVRALLCAETPESVARLELRCRLSDGREIGATEPDIGSTGTTDWTQHEVRLHLKPGQWAERLTLDLAGAKRSVVRIKDVTVHKTPIGPNTFL